MFLHLSHTKHCSILSSLSQTRHVHTALSMATKYDIDCREDRAGLAEVDRCSAVIEAILTVENDEKEKFIGAVDLNHAAFAR